MEIEEQLHMTILDTLVAEPPPLRVDPHGVIRVGKTRVTLDTVIEAYRDGATPEEIVQDYDVLTLADVHAVISHYLRHSTEVERYLQQRQQEREQVRRECEEKSPQKDIRERLRARQRRTS
jgi:uncharacterized protein (DUF433 family)